MNKPTPRHILVFDIGGTSLRGAIYDASTDSISNIEVMPTPNRELYPGHDESRLYETLLKEIKKIGSSLIEKTPVCAVSIGFPGPVDRSGAVLAGPGIWGRNPAGPIDMPSDLERIWPDLDIILNNDLTTAGYRYIESGDETFCLVTVSTGIGSKTFMKGRPLLGTRGTGGEIGHAKVLFGENAPRCDCGDKGHLQAVASGRGILEAVRHEACRNAEGFAQSRLVNRHESSEQVTNVTIAEAFQADDPFTCGIIERNIEPLAAMLVNLHLATGLERFIVIGGFALALGEKFRKALARKAEKLCWDGTVDWNGIIEFGLEDDYSGLIGAGRLANRCVPM